MNYSFLSKYSENSAQNNVCSTFALKWSLVLTFINHMEENYPSGIVNWLQSGGKMIGESLLKEIFWIWDLFGG